MYYASDRPIKKGSLLRKFADGTDMFRDERFKLIPSIVEVSTSLFSFTTSTIWVILEIEWYFKISLGVLDGQASSRKQSLSSGEGSEMQLP